MFYFAEVRNIMDESKSGRVQLRMYNRENDEKEIKNDHLAWGMPMMPSTSASTNRVGTVPTGLQVGSRVLCCFAADDLEQQYPIILGSYPRAFPPISGGDENTSDSEKDGNSNVNKEEAGFDVPTQALGDKEVVARNPINPRITPENVEIDV